MNKNSFLDALRNIFKKARVIYLKKRVLQMWRVL